MCGLIKWALGTFVFPTIFGYPDTSGPEGQKGRPVPFACASPLLVAMQTTTVDPVTDPDEVNVVAADGVKQRRPASLSRTSTIRDIEKNITAEGSLNMTASELYNIVDKDGDGEVTKDEFIEAKLAEFAADDDTMFEICCGGDRIDMVTVNKKKKAGA